MSGSGQCVIILHWSAKSENDSKCDVHANRQIVKSSNRNLNAILGISALLQYYQQILMHVYDTMCTVGSARKYVANRKLMQHHTESLNRMVFCRQWFAVQCFLFSMSHRHIFNHKSMSETRLPKLSKPNDIKHVVFQSQTAYISSSNNETYQNKHKQKVRHTPYYSFQQIRGTVCSIFTATVVGYNVFVVCVCVCAQCTYCVRCVCSMWKWIEAQFPIVLFVSLCCQRFIYVNMNCELQQMKQYLSVVCPRNGSGKASEISG